MKLRRRINANGSISVIWYCLACQQGAERSEPALAHGWVKTLLAKYDATMTIDQLPAVADYRLEVPPCVVCGALGTEVNHWMPQMFAEIPEVKPEWDRWANITAPLCRKHHVLWHKIVTPYMRQD